jgi:hypothetical protein
MPEISINLFTLPQELTTSTHKEIEEATVLPFHPSVVPRTSIPSGILSFILKLVI